MYRTTEELSVYWRVSAGPLASLIFVAPLLAIYELAVLWRPDLPRNATEVWLRNGFDWFGARGDLVLPLFVCGWLLFMHGLTCRNWRVPWDVLPAMFCEALLGGVCLIATLQVLTMVVALLPSQQAVPSLAIGGQTNNVVPLFFPKLAFVGTGIYEELFFRAMMISPIAWLVEKLGEKRWMSLTAAATVSSLLFALAHHRALATPGESFYWFTFAFRFTAGGLFAALYIFRGFGIAVGAHVAYDIFIASSAST